MDATTRRQGPTTNEATPRPAIVCRRMRDDDIDAAVTLLAAGFPERTEAYWRRGLLHLRDRTLPDDAPRYGMVIEADGRLVGITLLIYAYTDAGRVRANVSSWYVEPAYRGYSNALLASALRRKNVVFFNISPSPGTLDTIAAQGFQRYVAGTFHVVAALGGRVPGASVRAVTAGAHDAPTLLAEHAALGCISLEVAFEGVCYPFVFIRSACIGNRVPTATLVYCRDIGDVVRFAGPLGRHLLRHGLPLISLDANGPIDGLVGYYASGKRLKFYRGDAAPRLGDLSNTELVIFGP